MKTPDLTRFDFNALRFLKSENVEQMNAEEVGQHVLLMIHAWLGAKNASLPNVPDVLSRYARCERVSDAVMREWKEGPDGRLYNETLSEEWDEAVGRSLHGAKGAHARWGGKESLAKTEESQPPIATSSSQPPAAGKTNPQKRYSTIGKLADAAVSIWTGNRTIPNYTATDWREDLKRHAAQCGLEYSDNLAGAASPIEQAITIAEERLKGAG